jgi:hypothetical protein
MGCCQAREKNESKLLEESSNSPPEECGVLTPYARFE